MRLELPGFVDIQVNTVLPLQGMQEHWIKLYILTCLYSEVTFRGGPRMNSDRTEQ